MGKWLRSADLQKNADRCGIDNPRFSVNPRFFAFVTLEAMTYARQK